MPPDSVTTRSGNRTSFGENTHQAWLWDCWQDADKKIARYLGNRRAGLIINGDATEGSHHHTAELVAADVSRHVEMAHRLFTPLREKADKCWVVRGTECHTRDMEDFLARELKAQSGRAQDKWLIRFGDILVDATHHMGVTSRGYLEAGQMSIAMGNARLNAVRAGHPVAQVFLRGHRHCGGTFSDHAGLFVATGGWQFLTRHGHKVVPDSIPQPTIIVVDFANLNGDGMPTHYDLCYKAPQPKISNA